MKIPLQSTGLSTPTFSRRRAAGEKVGLLFFMALPLSRMVLPEKYKRHAMSF
jgi:hypothetical protein